MFDVPKEPYISAAYGEHGIHFQISRHTPGSLCFANHWHEGIEFLYIVSGTLTVFLGQEKVTATRGQIVIIMPHMPHHGIVGSQELICYMAAFDLKQFYNTTSATAKYLLPIFRHEVCFCPITEHPEIVAVMEEMYAKDAQHRFHPLYIQGKFYEMLGLLYQNCVTDSDAFHRPDEKFIEVLTYVNSFYTEDISTCSISKKFGYDEAYFCRRFKELTGLSTMKYIRLLRMEMAQNLLIGSHADIQTISKKCGYADSGYFSQCFKQQFGVTPQEFRELQFHSKS